MEVEMRICGIIGLHFCVLITGTLMAFHPTIFSGGRLVQTDPGDTLLNHYVLEHEWKWLTDSQYSASFWSPHFFHPTFEVLAYSENLIGTAPVYWLFRCFFEEVSSFQWWMMTVTALTYLSMAWVLRRLDVSHWLAAAGAAAFAFGLPRVSQLSHQQLLPAFYSPVAVYFACRLVQSPRFGLLICIIIFTYLQLLASVYLGWFLALGLIIFGLVAITSDREFRTAMVNFLRSKWIGICLLMIVSVVAVAGLLLPYATANESFHRSYSEVRLMLPRAESWLSPPPNSFWANLLPSVQGPLSHEQHLFPGAVFMSLLLIAGVALVRPSEFPILVRTTLVTALVLMLISLNIDKISAWKLIYRHVPGTQAIRAVTRIFSVVYLMGWIAVLVTVSHAWKRTPRLASVAGPIVLVIALAEQWQTRLPAFDPAPFFAETERLAQEMGMGGVSVAYVEPDPEAATWISELAAMWGGLKANVPVVNGYSGRKPLRYPDGILDSQDLAKWLGPCDDVRVIGPARLAHAYPMPIREFRPIRMLHAQREN
jgi:hypothetical protein